MKADCVRIHRKAEVMKLRTSLFVAAALLVLAFGAIMTTSAQSVEAVWTGEYFSNPILSDPPEFIRTDNNIAFDWGLSSPAGLPENEFTVRWTTEIFAPEGTYRFWARADDNISVIVDGNTIIDTFATNEINELITTDLQLSAGTHFIQVDYREFSGQAFAFFDFANLATNPSGPNFVQPTVPPTGAWTAQYFNNVDLFGTPVVTRGEASPSNNWGGGSPVPSIGADTWSARWTANLELDGGTYRIAARADDGVRVFVDGVLIIDEWHIARGEAYVETRSLTPGQHLFVIEYYESGGVAFLDFNIEQVEFRDGTALATVTTGLLNVRDAPNPFTGSILTQVANGETFTALARTPDSSWVQINANGVIGWVNASYAAVPDIFNLPVVGADGSQQPTGYTVTATPFAVNIRTGPGTQFRDIGNLPLNDTAQVIGRNAAATWWQINYNDIVGWVSAQYAVIESGADLSQIPVTE